MENINDLIFIFVLAFIVAGVYSTYRALSFSKRVNESIRERLNEIVHDIKVEKHHETIYWFDKDNDKFIAQGKTVDEIREVLKQRFPKHIFVVEGELMVGPDFNPMKPEDWRKALQNGI